MNARIIHMSMITNCIKSVSNFQKRKIIWKTALITQHNETNNGDRRHR